MAQTGSPDQVHDVSIKILKIPPLDVFLTFNVALQNVYIFIKESSSSVSWGSWNVLLHCYRSKTNRFIARIDFCNIEKWNFLHFIDGIGSLDQVHWVSAKVLKKTQLEKFLRKVNKICSIDTSAKCFNVYKDPPRKNKK